MNHDQIQKEISIIKSMIEKTRRETAESGHLFIFIGIFSAIMVFVLGILGIYHLHHLNLPVLIILAVVNGIIGYYVAAKEGKTEKVKTYAKSLFYSIWFACSIPLIMMTFLFPFLKVYPFHAIPVLVSLIFGIALFLTGAVYELRFMIWFSLVWWGGACIMALNTSPYGFLIMIALILIGWVLPGFILNKKYKNRSKENES